VKHYRKTLGAGLVTLTAAATTLTGGGPAQAAGLSWAYVESQTLYIQASLYATNTFHMSDSAEGFRVTDTTTGVQVDPNRTGGCTRPTADTIACPDTILSITLRLSDRDDYARNDTGRRLQAYGDDGNDKILGGGSQDSLYGGAGNDWLEGRGSVDTVLGGDGDDRMWGGEGNDYMTGELGIDEVHGESGNDWLTTPDNRDRLLGSFGNDTIRSSAFVDGGWGDDVIVVHHNDTGDLYGGLDHDVLDYRNWLTGVHVSLDGNLNDGGPNADCDDIVGCPVVFRHNAHGDFERVYGSQYDDKISGNGNPDEFFSGTGNDRLYGNGGDDHLDAEAGGQQTTSGGAGSDRCLGVGIARSGCEL
jgi:Ca2+-binding RTX toxin-like protein